MGGSIRSHIKAHRRHDQHLVGWLSFSIIVLLLFGELAVPRDVTLGTTVLIPIALACTFLDDAMAIAVVGFAAVARLIDASVGDIPYALAGVEILSFAVIAGLARMQARRLVPRPTRLPLDEYGGRETQAGPLPARFDAQSLTERERQVAEMAMRGLTAAQIGDRLLIGRRTVETHLARAYGKLGVRSKRDLVALNFDRGSAMVEDVRPAR